MGFTGGYVDPGDVFEDGSRPHLAAYVELRDRVREHMDRCGEPELAESMRPHGAYRWTPKAREVRRAYVNAGGGVDEIDLPGDGPDPLATPADFSENLDADAINVSAGGSGNPTSST